MPFVILTGASGSGKTAIAEAIEREHGAITVFRFDTIGVPSSEIMAGYGSAHQPGGAWQRAMTLQWFDRLIPFVHAPKPLLFEGQMRLAFIQEALATTRIHNARIVLVTCDDATRAHRLTHQRARPDLALDPSTFGWSRYLYDEAVALGCDILDTTHQTLEESVNTVTAMLLA